MSKFATATAAIALLIAAGPAFAQTKAPAAAPVDAKFVAADTDKSGSLEGKETDVYKADLVKIDTNKDGKISKQEFEVAMQAGVIK